MKKQQIHSNRRLSGRGMPRRGANAKRPVIRRTGVPLKQVLACPQDTR